ncbi:MAG: AAA family ATPase, partial [Opitutales bacterium]|nr:AAA family ATPase [Opitutales bacterium]
MYLKEIVINGFKSFADRTRIDLKPGITAIVGPNGCGKSNIVDAIRWVLGEQSAKALRGGSMHDVIFSGTDKRKPLPYCEVELIFADCEKDLGTAFNEVSIVRRVSREDSSDYFLNGKSCRLKDIQRLFMDTGVGRVSYSFMVQGQIDQILSANPAERRTLFEEAAGITRYKAQRKEALSKLGMVDQNLARITDVIDEISRQIGSLKRQAAKALRYKRTQHRLRHLDLASLAHQFCVRRATITDLEARAGTLRETVADRRNALREREEKLAETKVARAELFQRIEQGTQMAFALRSEKEN